MAVIRGRAQFAKYQKAMYFLARILSKTSISFRSSLLNAFRYTGGRAGLGLRYACLKAVAHECGENVAIYPGCYILNPQNMRIGDHVSIQPMCYLECGKQGEGISIEDNVSIAHGATLIATTHVFERRDIPIKDQEVIAKPIYIESDVWIGAKATVLSGVRIGTGGVIGAGAVVTRDTLPYHV